jgi:hypothetical protein
MLALFLPALYLNLRADQTDLRLAPLAQRFVESAALALPILPPLFLLGLLVRWRKGARPERGEAILQGVLLIVQALIGVAGTVVLLIFTNPDFLFADKFVTQRPSPDGKQVAYVYSRGLFCGFNLYVGAPGELLIHRVAEGGMARDCAAMGTPDLAWSADSAQVRIVNADGAPMPDTGGSLFGPWH